MKKEKSGTEEVIDTVAFVSNLNEVRYYLIKMTPDILEPS